MPCRSVSTVLCCRPLHGFNPGMDNVRDGRLVLVMLRRYTCSSSTLATMDSAGINGQYVVSLGSYSCCSCWKGDAITPRLPASCNSWKVFQIGNGDGLMLLRSSGHDHFGILRLLEHFQAGLAMSSRMVLVFHHWATTFFLPLYGSWGFFQPGLALSSRYCISADILAISLALIGQSLGYLLFLLAHGMVTTTHFLCLLCGSAGSNSAMCYSLQSRRGSAVREDTAVGISGKF